MAEAGIGFVDILPRTDAFATRLTSQVSTAINRVSAGTASSVSNLTRGVQAAFVGLGVVAVAAITKGIEATVSWAAQVRTLQRVTGQSAESASSFAFAADKLGIGVDKLTVGFGLFAKNIATGNKALAFYGIQTKDAEGNTRSFEDIFGQVADKFNSLPKGIDQTGLALRLFGRSGRNIIPLLAQGSAGFDTLREAAAKAGLILSQDDVDAAKQLSIAQRELSSAVQGAAVSLGKGFVPAATAVVKIATQAVEVISKVPGPVLDTAAAIAVLTGAVAAAQLIGAFFTSTWTKVLVTLHLKTAADEEAAGSSAALTASMGLQADAVTALTAAIDRLVIAVGGELPVAEGEAVAAGSVWETQLAALNAAAIETEASSGALGAVLGGFATGFAGAVLGVGALVGGFIALRSAARSAHAAFVAGTATDLKILQQGGPAAARIRQLAAQPVLAPARPVFFGQQRNVFDPTGSIDRARAATGQLDEAQRIAALSTQKLTASIADQVKEIGPDGLQLTLTSIPPLLDAVSAATGRLGSSFSGLSTTSGQDFKSIGSAIQTALNDPKTTIADLPGIFSSALQKTKETMRSWHDAIVQNFGGAQAALSSFLGQVAGSGPNKVSFENLTKSLADTQTQLHRWSSDFSTILRESGKRAKRFLQDMSANGLQSIGILDVVAQQPKKIRDAFFAQYNEVNKQTDTIATQITDAFGKAADRIIAKLQELIRITEGKPARPQVDNKQALQAFDELIARERLAFQIGSQKLPIGPPGTGPVRPNQPLGAGGIISGATGFVTNGPVFQFGERGRELVDPLEGDRAKRLRAQSIADALKLLGIDGQHSRDQHIHVTVGMDDSGQLQVRRIARDEIDREHDYRARVTA